MPTISATRGVCSTCKYDPECMYEAGSEGVILQCEQFELAPPAPVARPTATQPRDLPVHAMEANGYAGLCSNCENRETCIYPKPEGGVWRCEEYA